MGDMLMTKWLCIASTPAGWRNIVIECSDGAVAVDARNFALRLIGENALQVLAAADDEAVDIGLRYQGSDAGGRPNRRLEVRYWHPSGWSRWERAA